MRHSTSYFTDSAIIGASLSEPHTLVSKPHACLYVYYVCVRSRVAYSIDDHYLMQVYQATLMQFNSPSSIKDPTNLDFCAWDNPQLTPTSLPTWILWVVFALFQT